MNQVKRNTSRLTKRPRMAKKAILFMTVLMCMMSMTAMNVFAASGTVDATNFISTSVTVLQSVVSLIGAGLGIWGIVNLVEGYGGDNAAAKSQGMKQFIAGAGLILVGLVVVPVLGDMISGAM